MLITASFGTANTGLSVYYTVLNEDKSVYQSRRNTGVTELTAGSGTYGVNVSLATIAGKTVVWDIDATAKTATETFENIAYTVWSDTLSGAVYNDGMAGKRLKQMTANIIHSGIARAATVNTIQLDTLASATVGAYDPALIYIVDGTGAGQCRLILQYDPVTKIAAVDRDWRTQPSTDSEFIIVGDTGREHVNEGLLQGATLNTATLNTSASSVDNTYVGQRIFVRSGYGADQSARISAYDGTTKVATLESDWVVVPNTTSGYVILPTGTITDAEIGSAVEAVLPTDYMTNTDATVAAIDAQTSQMVFTVPGKIDATAEATVDAQAIADAVVAALPPLEDGFLVTPNTIGTDADPIGRVMPYGVVTVYLGSDAQYRFDADADGDFSYRLPYGSVWTLIGRKSGYQDTTAEVSTVV